MSGVDLTAGKAPNLGFAEAAREAEERARAEQQDVEPEQLSVEEAAAVEAPAADQEAPVETAEPEEPTSAEKLLAGRFKTEEELERGYLELLQVTSRQGNELGDLRRAYDERLAEIERRQAEPAPARVQVTPDLIDANPAYAAQVAYEQKDMATLEVAISQWKAIDETAATAWLLQAHAAERERELRADYDAKLQALEKRIGPLAQAGETAELRAGVEALPAEAKAFLADQQLVESLATEFPSIGTVIVSGTPAQRLEAVKALYEIQRGRNADNLATSTQEVARLTAVEAQQARDDAHVASTQTASADEPKTREQIEQDAFVASVTRNRNFRGGLVRPGR